MSDKKLQVELSVLDNATKQLRGVAGEFNGFQSKVMAFGKAVSSIFVGGAVVQGLQSMAQSAIDMGDNISDSSAKLGLSATAFQQWSYVAKTSGSDINNLAAAFPSMAKEAASSSDIIGVATRDTNGALKNSSVLFQEVILKIAGIENPTERAAVALKVFGKSGKDVFAIASQGKEEITKLIGETEKYGLVLSDEMVKKLDSAKDSQERMDTSLQVFSATLVTTFSPAIVSATTAVSAFFGTFQTASDQKQLEKTRQELEKMENLQFGGKGSLVDKFLYGDRGQQEARRKALEADIDLLEKRISGAGKQQPANAASQYDSLFDEEARKKREAALKKLHDEKIRAGREANQDEESYWQGLNETANKEFKQMDEDRQNSYQIEQQQLENQNQLRQEQAAGRIRILQWEAQQEVDIKNNLISATMTSNSAIASLARQAVSQSRASAREKKNILIGIALMEQAAAAVTNIQAGIEEGSQISPWLGVVDGVAAGLAAVATFAGSVAAIEGSSFALGGSFTTNGPRNITVGDNPGGRERVTVTPVSSQNVNGPDMGSTAHFHFYNSSGQEVESLKAQIHGGEWDNGIIPMLKKRMGVIA